MGIVTNERQSEILLQNLDYRDCGIVAIQALTGLPRKNALKLAIEESGYDPEIGIYRGDLERSFRAVGYTVSNYPLEPGTSVASFAIENERGSFIVYIEKHVMALVDGDLFNSRGSWFDQVEMVKKVVRP